MSLTYYKEWAPHPSLEFLVDRYWYIAVRGNDSPVMYAAPSGTIDLVTPLHESIAYCQLNGQWQQYDKAAITGLMEVPLTWKLEPSGSLFGIRLKPHAASLLFDLDLQPLTHKVMAVATLYKSNMYAMCRQVARARNQTNRLAVVEATLGQLSGRYPKARTAFAKAMEAIWNASGKMDVQQLSECVGLGSRQLQRLFQQYMGIRPKQYIRLVRLGQALHLANAHPTVSWRNLATHAGYSSPLHFSRDCKAIFGKAPQQLLAAM